jgi:hypothetical protein
VAALAWIGSAVMASPTTVFTGVGVALVRLFDD